MSSASANGVGPEARAPAPGKFVSGAAWALYSKEGRRATAALFAIVFAMLGAAHMVKLHFSPALVLESWREYGMLCVAGFLFGWLFVDSLREYAAAYILDLGGGLLLRPQAGWLLAVLAFVVVLHQVRYFLNDGPANIALALGIAAAALAERAPLAEGIIIPESFTTLMEANRMDDAFSAGILGSLYRMDPYSPMLFGILALMHRRRGNRLKAGLAEGAARLLTRNRV